jgi:DNA-binding XRE family transcriptional regulator
VLSRLAEDLGVGEAAVSHALNVIGAYSRNLSEPLDPALVRQVKMVVDEGYVAEDEPPFIPNIDPGLSSRENLANALRSLRRKNGATLRAVASAVEYSASSVSAAETGNSLPRWELVEKIARLFGANAEAFRELHTAAENEAAPVKAPGYVYLRPAAPKRRMSPPVFEDCVPPGILDAFTHAWSSLKESNYGMTLVLSRWVAEAVVADQGVAEPSGRHGLRALEEAGRIDRRLAKWGDSMLLQANQVAHSPGSPVKEVDAKSAVGFVSALLAQIYVINGQYERFNRHDR